MPDYASILRRSVSALPDPTPEMREAVYQRARAALARQLTAVDPPLSSHEIETQHQELEDAVARLEAEFAPQAPPPPPPPEPAYEPPKDEFVFTPQAPSPEPVPPPPPRPTAPVPPVRDDIAEDIADEFEADDEDEDDYDDDEDRASRTPALIGLLVVVLVIVGIGGYAYSQRDAVLGLFGLGSDETMQASPAAEVTPQDDGAGDKIADRLTNGPESPPEAQESNDSVMIVPNPPEAAEETTTPTEAVEPEGGQLAAAETGDVGTSLVGQRAIYYYQGAEGQAGEALDGTVSWAEITKDGQPAIRATISIPENEVQVTVTIYKNYDDTLPASQMVEIQFSGSLSDSPIQRVPALVLKQTEQARGQPLAGAAVPVTNELFWIALSDDDEQAARNVQLLKEGSWFDVPILFSDQTRALFTFEKGIPGDKVFNTVMASWTP
jgi:hypothetical protein